MLPSLLPNKCFDLMYLRMWSIAIANWFLHKEMLVLEIVRFRFRFNIFFFCRLRAYHSLTLTRTQFVELKMNDKNTTNNNTEWQIPNGARLWKIEANKKKKTVKIERMNLWSLTVARVELEKALTAVQHNIAALLFFSFFFLLSFQHLLVDMLMPDCRVCSWVIHSIAHSSRFTKT